jgi:2-oxoglutarate dehydrogenase E2 component (dihydrolipoamide succinyltransferase)
MSSKIIMPEMGEGVIEGTIVAWLKQEGDPVEIDDPVLEIETDKVTVEVVADSDGVLLKTLVEAGTTVGVGATLAIIGEEGESLDGDSYKSASPKSTPMPERPQPVQVASQPNVSASMGFSREHNGVRMSPVVARMAQEHNLDLLQINGSGRNGRITKKDVLADLESKAGRPQPVIALTPQPAPQPMTAAKPAETPLPGDVIPLTAMRRSIAEHMVMSKRTSPHATTVFELDYTATSKHRAANKEQFARDGAKLTYMPYIIMATVEALKKHPIVNAMWTDDGILLKREINIGMATAVPSGLLVPVIKNADSMNLLGLARVVSDLAERARTNKLQPVEVQGGTFTITNHGASGSLIGAPIINQPQVGILGVGMIEKRVKVINDAIAIRPCGYVSLSFDHRILDGASADAFMMDIKQRIENWS